MSVGHDFELGTDGPSVVVLGVDGSRTSSRAGHWAGGLARRQGSRLIAVHVTRPAPAGGMAGLTPGGSAAMAATAREVLDQLRLEVDEGAAYHGVTVELQHAVGDPFHEISRIADENRADLIVVGASESAGHRLLGSLAVRLVRAGRWPVTVVP